MDEGHSDEIKVSSEPMDVILVGGGSIIIPRVLDGAARVVTPGHFGTANGDGFSAQQGERHL